MLITKPVQLLCQKLVRNRYFIICVRNLYVTFLRCARHSYGFYYFVRNTRTVGYKSTGCGVVFDIRHGPYVCTTSQIRLCSVRWMIFVIHV